MIKFGTRKAGRGRKSRGTAKFPRGTKKLKNFEGTHLCMRAKRWAGVKIIAENVDRFLRANVGRPIDKVFSEFLERCDKTITNPRETFFGWIEKKDELGCWGGFYVTNGILNYKKRKRRHNKKGSHYDIYLEFNKKSLPDNKTLRLACNKATRDGLTLLGKFYFLTGYNLGIELKNVFIRDVSSFAGFFKFKTVEVLGIGRYLYKQLRINDKGIYMSVEPSYISPTRTTSNHNVFEFIIKEE